MNVWCPTCLESTVQTENGRCHWCDGRTEPADCTLCFHPAVREIAGLPVCSDRDHQARIVACATPQPAGASR